MSHRQLAVVVVSVTLLALALAWTIERAQVRRFMMEFERWDAERMGRNDEPGVE